MDPHRGACGTFLRLAKWVPVLFISAIVAWSYYAYVWQLCFLTVQSLGETLLLLILYHVFFVLFVWSYWRTIATHPGSVPQRFYLTPDEMDSIEGSNNQRTTLEQILVSKDLPCSMRSVHQEVRYCSECSLIKPDRAHHCSVCGTCVLKMDHHCPWVNNCVAFYNYKFFVLFLGYALFYCIYVALSTLKYFLQFWSAVSQSGEAGKFHVLFLFFVSAMFSISLASLFSYHLYLVSRNLTTLEAFRTPILRGGPDKKAFHLGAYNNFQEVFGDNKHTWFLPVFTSFGDGLVFPQRGQLDEEAGLLEQRSPPSSASEERVPMMTTAESGSSSGGSSSSGSYSQSEIRNGSAAASTMIATGNGSARIHPAEMITINM